MRCRFITSGGYDVVGSAMLSFPSVVRIYLCCQPTDMRRSFDGLAYMVREIIGQDPLSGHVFVFRNKRGNMLKLLYWDRDGFAIWYKRLEKGTFSWPDNIPADYKLASREFAMMLEGVEWSKAKKAKRFSLKQ